MFGLPEFTGIDKLGFSSAMRGNFRIARVATDDSITVPEHKRWLVLHVGSVSDVDLAAAGYVYAYSDSTHSSPIWNIPATASHGDGCAVWFFLEAGDLVGCTLNDADVYFSLIYVEFDVRDK